MHQFRHCTRVMAVAALVALASASRAQVLYDQPNNFPGGTVWASQNDTTGGLGPFATVYDNFTLPSLSQVCDVHWTGGNFNPGVQGNITAFTIAFYADAAGQPGAPLLSQTIGGNANETFLGNDFFGPVFTYDVDLPICFSAAAGVPYWLSIVPDMGFPPQWGWYTGTGGDGVGFQDFFGSRSNIGTDFAFTLTGTAVVPEPGAVALLIGSGFTGLLLIRRRK